MSSKLAKGICRSKNGMIRVVCDFDKSTFVKIRKIAEDENTSFAEQVRTLTENALEDRINEQC